MQVTGTIGTTTQGVTQVGSQSAPSTGTLDYSAFLRLLIAELKNQDPTKPIDSAQYIGQLASFSNVEQSIKLNAKLDTLIAAQQLGQAESLIGKVVSSADGAVTGKVTGLYIGTSGTTAILANGTELELGPGIRVTSP